MTPKEKAKDLFRKVNDCVCGDINDRCAWNMSEIIVSEILNVLNEDEKTETGKISHSNGQGFWYDVIREIENIRL